MGLFSLILMAMGDIDGDERVIHLLGALVLSAYLSVSWTIYREAHGKSKAVIVQIAIALFFCALAWFFANTHFMVFAAIPGSILLLGNSVRFRRERNDIHVWDFTHKIWVGAIFATIGSVIFFLGTMAIWAALKTLFSIDMEDLATGYLLPIGLGFLAPLYWLSTVPRVDEDYNYLANNPDFVPKAASNMATWLLVPLVTIYALILAAYSGSILIARELPKGQIAELTTPFILVGTLTWLILEPPFIQKQRLAKMFRQIWFWLVLPAAVMLTIAILVRVVNYGLTEERILLLLGAFWALIIGSWFSFRKERAKDIRYIPGLAAGFLFFAGFTGGFISDWNQTKRFSYYMKSSGFVVENQIIPKSTELISSEDAAKAMSALRYLSDRGSIENVLTKLEFWGHPTAQYYGVDGEIVFNGVTLERDLRALTKSKISDTGYHVPNKAPTRIWKYPGFHGKINLDVRGYDFTHGRFRGLNSYDTYDLNDVTIEFQPRSITGLTNGQTIFEYDLEPYLSAVSEEAFEPESSRIILFEDGGKRVAFQFLEIRQHSNGSYDYTGVLLTAGFKPNP